MVPTWSVLSILALATAVAVMLVVHVVVILWALRRGGRASSRGAEEERAGQLAADGCGGEGRQGLSADELDALPCYDFKDAAAGRGGGDCAVCLEAFEAGDRCRRLPRCEHGFHALCVDPWLLEKSHCCPVCRADVVVVGDRRKGETKAADEPSSMEMAERRSPASTATATATLDVVLER